MESEASIGRAKQTVRAYLNGSIRRHSRIHDDAKDAATERLRALEGKCGKCAFLRLQFEHIDGKDVVKLRCEAGLSPLDLYRNTPFGTEANCPKFEKK